jgi:hypothetical protein
MGAADNPLGHDNRLDSGLGDERRLSKELEDALNQMAHLMERAQKQQYEIMSLFAKSLSENIILDCIVFAA